MVMYGGSFVGMTQWHTATQHPPHLRLSRLTCPSIPGWDVPNTNGIPQAWTAVILGYTSGRALNHDLHPQPGLLEQKMLEQYAAQRPFAELDGTSG